MERTKSTPLPHSPSSRQSRESFRSMSRLDSIGETSDAVSLVRSRRTTLDSAYDLYASDASADPGGKERDLSEQAAVMETTLAPSFFALSLSTGFGGSFDENLIDIKTKRSKMRLQPVASSYQKLSLGKQC